MKSLRIHEFGGPSVVHLEEAEIPTPQSGEVLICVKAASVNPVDLKTRAGKFALVREDKLPLTLGRDVGGRIHAVGPNAFSATVGDEVFVNLPFDQGGFANYTIARAEDCAQKPRSLDYVSAAAVPLAATTAWQGLFTHGGLIAGQRVLITGASGGVGQFAVQFARSKGANVLAVASPDCADLLEELGADEVIDYKVQTLGEAADDVDLVLDLVGGKLRDAAFATLRPGGILVSTLDEPDQVLARRFKVRAMRFTTAQSREQLTAIAKLIDDEEVHVNVVAEFDLDDYAKAFELVEKGHPKGKVVLRINP